MTLQPRLNTSDDSYIFLIERSISLHTWRPTSTTGEEEEEEEAEFRLKFLRLVSIGSLTAGTERSWRASCFGVLITTQDLFFLWERLLNLRVIDQKKKKPGTSWTASTDWSDRIHPPGSGKKRAASPFRAPTPLTSTELIFPDDAFRLVPGLLWVFFSGWFTLLVHATWTASLGDRISRLNLLDVQLRTTRWDFEGVLPVVTHNTLLFLYILCGRRGLYSRRHKPVCPRFL